MKNNTNIYDVDGDLIRAANDNHQMTIEEAQERVKMYNEKLKEIGENDPKSAVYINYIQNLTRYIFNLYSKMTPKEISERIERIESETTEEDVKKALEELKTAVEEPEETTETTAEEPKEVVMDEYIEPIECDDTDTAIQHQKLWEELSKSYPMNEIEPVTISSDEETTNTNDNNETHRQEQY